MGDPHDPMAEIKASFFIECEELLEALQDGLQTLEDGGGDDETINVVFRAVHSIKGGAGAFGLEALVRFAHRFETVLDEVRAGRLDIDAEALKVFFLCGDHLSDLVRVSRDDAPIPSAQSDALSAQLDAMLGDAPQDTPQDDPIDFQPMGLSFDLDLDDEPDAPPVYQITFTPSAELFESGNEPFHLFRALEELGPCQFNCDSTRLTDPPDFEPEQSYLSWKIDLASTCSRAEIEATFEFVEGLCSLDIVPSGQEPPGDLLLDSALPDLPAPKPLTDKPVAEITAPSADLTPDMPETVADLPSPPPSAAPAARPDPAKPAATSGPKSVVRVDLDRIERLVNLVGELVINQAMLSQSLEQSGLSPHSDAMSGLEEFQRLTRDIQDSVMMIRAQPVKSLFQRMSRIVREASSAVGKDVRLITEGEATEVDKTVIERLADPLTHMIRNAVDHGLETPQDRAAAGKPAQGQVHLKAAHRSGRVIIEVSDDGAGINRPKVLQIAIDKGLVPAEASLSDSEIDNLLFLPGFSTASVVSDLSGRGVGMDVVRNSIQTLGGRISISSTPGQGTVFSISLPLTLAVLDGMVVQVADETLVLPLNVVIETLALNASDIEMVRPGVQVVRVRSGFVPLFDLGKELGYRAPLQDYDGSVVLLIAHEDGSRAALVIDSIQDQRQVVIKGLDASFYRAPGIAAATILGDGQIALIIDTADIISNASAESAAPTLEGLTA